MQKQPKADKKPYILSLSLAFYIIQLLHCSPWCLISFIIACDHHKVHHHMRLSGKEPQTMGSISKSQYRLALLLVLEITTAVALRLNSLLDFKLTLLILVVQHNYAPTTPTKMDGQMQTTYPRKNWSSMVLYNCGHPKNRVLTPEIVSSQTGAFLHRSAYPLLTQFGRLSWISLRKLRLKY